MELDIDKKSQFENRLQELLNEGEAISDALPGIEIGHISQENILIHKWCARFSLLLEGTLDSNSLLVETVRNSLKKAKNPQELFEKMLGVAKAVAEGCKAGDLDNRFMRMSKEESERLDNMLAIEK